MIFFFLLYSTHLCKFFYGEIKTTALRKLYKNRMCCFSLFCVLGIFGVDSSQNKIDSQFIRPEVTKTLLFGSKIHNLANSASYLNSIRKAEEFDFGENSYAKLDISASGWILRQNTQIFLFFHLRTCFV